MTYQPTESEMDLIRTTVRDCSPTAVLQVGTGCYGHTSTLISAIQTCEGAHLTLIANQDNDATLSKLKEAGLDEWAEIIHLPADQVLPDFYFQEHRFDLAIVNPDLDFKDAIVAMHYINKMLHQNDRIIINGTSHGKANEEMRRLVRYLLNTEDYRIKNTSPALKQMPKIERLIRDRYNKLPRWIHRPVQAVINPAIINSDASLGINGNVIVLEKISVSTEKPEEHIDVDAMIEAMI